MSTQFPVGAVVRMQLAPHGKDCRWTWDEQLNIIDRGYGGPWVDAVIIANQIDGDPSSSWHANNLIEVQYDCPVEKERFYSHIPDENHAIYNKLAIMPGWPSPPPGNQGIRVCCCGAGDDAPGHSDWCDRLKDLKALGMWDGV